VLRVPIHWRENHESTEAHVHRSLVHHRLFYVSRPLITSHTMPDGDCEEIERTDQFLLTGYTLSPRYLTRSQLKVTNRTGTAPRQPGRLTPPSANSLTLESFRRCAVCALLAGGRRQRTRTTLSRVVGRCCPYRPSIPLNSLLVQPELHGW
jgi:hypothetical protein